MKIRNKIIVLLSAVFLVLALVEWGVEEMLLLPRFEQIELEGAHTAMKRISQGVTQALGGLQVSVTDWGNWADTYRYMADHNAAYEHENLSITALKQLHLTLLAFVDNEGHVRVSQSIDPNPALLSERDVFPGGALPADSPWRDNLRQARPAQGLIATRHGVLLGAISPVLDGFGHGPSRGMVFMGRLLTEAEIAEIGARAQTAVVITHMRHAFERAVAAGGRGAGLAAVDPVAIVDDVTQVSHSFNDIYGDPVLTLRVDVPRTISARAATTIAYARAFTFAAGIATLLLLLVLLDRIVLQPLSVVTRHAIRLGAGDDLSGRLNLGRRDEIGALATEFDRMVTRVADSRRKLIDTSFESGRAELSRGILHNIGNAMTPLGVRVARLQARLREAPVADVTRAVSERTAEPAGSERQADLDAFVRLASVELADALRAAEGDVGVIARQAGLVQAALSDQLRSARGETVIELVELRTLVEQSLEIVPDVCRDQATVRLDPSLETVGAVRVARTLLRLVLQNLIINAAEATRAASRGRGEIRLSAETGVGPGSDQLVLHCEDVGVGIPPDHLERVFERGFSTKGDASSRGIGLHWCATAVASLGGRIWATSDGAGRGAIFHVQLPLNYCSLPSASEAA